jgi:U3 small nucleolar RNA-associated protein 22
LAHLATAKECAAGDKRTRNTLSPSIVTHTKPTSRSSIFTVQIGEFLSHIRPKHGKKEVAVEEALHALRSTIEKIPAREPLPIDEAVRSLSASSKGKAVVPFPDPQPSKDVKYKLQYVKPSNINVVGSYAHKTYCRTTGPLEIDMTVTMPSSIFQEKDYLNYRYFYKRAYYLACIANGLQSTRGEEFSIRFNYLHNDQLRPTIVVMPVKAKETSGSEEECKAKWQINIIPCVASDVFSREKLRPDSSCIRTSAVTNGDNANHKSPPTPFYNSSLRADMLVPSYLKLLHAASKRCAEWKDACLLGRTWLRQRGFGAAITNGGFGNFEWSALMALLLECGRPGVRAVLGEAWSSQQLIKSMLQFLAARDASTSAISLVTTSDKTSKSSATPAQNGAPVIWDGDRAHNLLFKMTPWSYKLLRHEARTTLNLLADQQFAGAAFEAAFFLRTDEPLYRYDYILQVNCSHVAREKVRQTHAHGLAEFQRMYEILQRGLGDRITLLNIAPQTTESRQLDCTGLDSDRETQLRVGFVVNPDTVHRTVDHGPSAEDKAEAASFRTFWGEKAELRRFKDGSILESLVWDGKNAQSVFEQIVRYVVRRHFGKGAEKDIRLVGDRVNMMLPQISKIDAFKPLMDAYTQLESDIRSLENLPLSVRQIMPCDAQLRYASTALPGSGKRQVPADVTIQFEGSTRWPDDLVAIQRTKIAFLLNIAEKLQESVDTITACVGLENEENDILNQAFLDIIYDSGAAFRLRIHHEREQALLERKLKDKTIDPPSNELAATGLAKYKRNYIKSPAFTQAIARLCSLYPALSGTIRMTKKWFASHLLSNHIAAEVIEMLVVRTFVQPWPWSTPSSVQTGFLRTLSWLARWDWRSEPLIVDLSGSSGDFKQADVQALKTKFEAWRKLDPALNRVVLFCGSNVDADGFSWTDGRTPKVVAARMTALARAASFLPCLGRIWERNSPI